MRLLGLSDAASMDEIKHAYRELAQRFHPDKTGGDEDSRTRFIAICRAYRCLMQAARATQEGRRIGACHDCGEFGEVAVSLEGKVCCPRCLLRPTARRLLPMPALTVVKCMSVVVLLGVSVYLLLMGMATGEGRYAIGAFLAGAGGLGLLAIICVNVAHCITPLEDASRIGGRRRAGSRPRRR